MHPFSHFYGSFSSKVSIFEILAAIENFIVLTTSKFQNPIPIMEKTHIYSKSTCILQLIYLHRFITELTISPIHGAKYQTFCHVKINRATKTFFDPNNHHLSKVYEGPIIPGVQYGALLAFLILK
jgi:hypothetical protein